MLTPDDLSYNKNNKIVKERLEILIDEAIKNTTGKFVDIRFEISDFNNRTTCKFSKDALAQLLEQYELVGWFCIVKYLWDRNVESVHIAMRSK